MSTYVMHPRDTLMGWLSYRVGRRSRYGRSARSAYVRLTRGAIWYCTQARADYIDCPHGVCVMVQKRVAIAVKEGNALQASG
jgi:hypothetical protein